jgi:hypothetical protein
MRLAMVYERKGNVLVHATSQTDQGVWVIDGTCVKVPVSDTDSAIGVVVLHALEESKTVPHPKMWRKDLFDPVLQAAGVKSWETFVRFTKGVEVEMDGSRVTLLPLRNMGAEEGFVPIENIRRVVETPDPAVLGSAVKDMLAKAT